MTQSISPIFLHDVASGLAIEAELHGAISDKHLADWEAEWVPELQEAIKRLNKDNVERAGWPESRHWNWARKMKSIEGLLGQQSCAVVCDGLTQGMMIVGVTSRGRITSQVGQHLVYVDYLEAAPWNRMGLHYDQPRYRGVGSVLVLAAIEQSKLEGFKGRVGLHSLPQANNFYSRSGFTDLGIDKDYQNLRYFEMTPEKAEEYIQGGMKP